jgi:hypothetical protein
MSMAYQVPWPPHQETAGTDGNQEHLEPRPSDLSSTQQRHRGYSNSHLTEKNPKLIENKWN